jgi:type I restriction-modification system DNA methylase subunit
MFPNIWLDIEKSMNDHAYMTGIDRTVERVKATGEIFTPTELVIEMLRSTPIESLSPGKKVLDPACGDGQFLIGAKLFKMMYFKMNAEDALSDIYGVDIMRDNVDLCKARLGGGHIVMGNTLNPGEKIVGQTKQEFEFMKANFLSNEQFQLF